MRNMTIACVKHTTLYVIDIGNYMLKRYAEYAEMQCKSNQTVPVVERFVRYNVDFQLQINKGFILLRIWLDKEKLGIYYQY